MKRKNYWTWVPEIIKDILVFDIETNGFLDKTSLIHSLVIRNLGTGEMWSCTDHDYESPRGATVMPIKHGLEMLDDWNGAICGHNIIKFDLPAIKKLHPMWKPSAYIMDTLTASRLIWSDLKENDFKFKRKNKWFPGKLMGSHSLGAWGYRLGERKDTFGETTDWQEWSYDMQDYCEQDVIVNCQFAELILKKNYSLEALELEHDFQEIIWMQEQFGFPFDVKKAQELYAVLAARRAELLDELQKLFPPKVVKTPFTPKVNNKKMGYVKGVPTFKVKEVPFNPASRPQIGERLMELGWKPTEFTPSGQPKVAEETLEKLPYEEAHVIAEYLMVAKRLGQLAEGKQAWLKLEKDGRIHGGVITNGAVSGRCTHMNPNVAQVPSVGVPYGKECRELFYAPEDWVVVGCDASGLELRCLAHFITKFDGGAYMKILLEGDIHTANQKAAGLPERSHAKRFIYAFLYGAGNELLGSILEPKASPEKQAAIGKKLRNRFLKQTPALKELIETVQAAVKRRGYLKGLDGRKLHPRSLHSCLNLLFQSAGALIMKKATVLLHQELHRRGYVFGKDYGNVAHVHDEYQLLSRPDIADEVGQVAVWAIVKAGEHFKFRCPLDGEYKIGKNWAETH